MPIPGGLLTTAMAVMPHRDVGRALETRMEEVWSAMQEKGIDRDLLFARSLLSPATCCLVNPDGEKTVEKAFEITRRLSKRLRGKYRL